MMKSLSDTCAAIESSEHTPRTGISRANAKLCANAIPTLNPVNGPGPIPTTTSSTSLTASASCTNAGRDGP